MPYSEFDINISNGSSGPGYYFVKVVGVSPTYDSQRREIPQYCKEKYIPERALRELRNLWSGVVTNPAYDYGKTLYELLFSDTNDAGETVFEDDTFVNNFKLALSDNPEQKIRIRVLIDNSAKELNSIKWECLLVPGILLTSNPEVAPETEKFIVWHPRVIFSRYFENSSSVKLTYPGKNNVLLAISNPDDLSTNNFFTQPERGSSQPESDSSQPAVNLAPPEYDLEQGLQNFEERISNLDIHSLCLHKNNTPNQIASSNNLFNTLKQGPDGSGKNNWHTLILILDGIYDETRFHGQPFFAFEKTAEDGSGYTVETQSVSGRSIANGFQKLSPATKPNLVILASRSSLVADRSLINNPVGALQDSCISQLAPLLIDAGIPSVIVLEEGIAHASFCEIIENLLTKLKQSKTSKAFLHIDESMKQARISTFHRVGQYTGKWWESKLFVSLNNGLIHSPLGILHETSGIIHRAKSKQFKQLNREILRGKCIPILGPELVKHVLGDYEEIAAHFAEKSNYPLKKDERKKLIQVAQYLSVDDEKRIWMSDLLGYLIHKLGSSKSEDEINSPSGLLLDLVKQHWTKNKNNEKNYTYLANLKVPVYVTTNFIDLMTYALLERPEVKKVRRKVYESPSEPSDVSEDFVVPITSDFEKTQQQTQQAVPQGMTTRSDGNENAVEQGDNQAPYTPTWNEKEVTDEDGYAPSYKTPLVYHLYGHFGRPDNIVISQKEYFDFMLQHDNEIIDTEVRYRMAKSSLLFLGFQIDDWGFRVLLRTINQMVVNNTFFMPNYQHIGVQIDPESVNPKDARDYLVKYISDMLPKGVNIDIYWGSIEDFFEELRG